VLAKVAQIDRLAAEVDRLGARLDAVRSQLQIEGRERQERVSGELQMLETLVKQLAEKIPGGTGRPPANARSQEPPPPPPLPEGATLAPGQDGWSWSFDAAPEPAPLGALDAARIDAAVLDAVRRSIEANKIDLYLQPIVTLPQRRVRYYEALTRLRDAAGNILLPKDYLGVAESAGMMPMIDNVMLYRSVQVLKRLSERASARGVFCNVSIHSLLDAEFFPEFIAFMEQNKALSEGLCFEFTQRMIESCGPMENESLAALSRLGFRFVLDQVRSLDVDFASLHNKGFRFIKIEGDLLLHRMAEAGARIHAADMRAYLDRHGLEMIVEKIEDERVLAELLDFDVKLGQGYLFSEPRPVRPEVFGRADGDAEAA
jgi:cyclic-di-GMP phosphodiesterase TipF (flagellum assembly factor)